jgi:hypothetical protein
MASFKVIRELASLERDKGSKRLLLALYSASDEGSQQDRRYIALSEMTRTDTNSEWVSARKGITIRRGELDEIISALKSADFDSKPDGKGLSDREYIEATVYIT